MLLLTFSLILHQLLTKNQVFIFFLVPILTAFSQISLIDGKLKFKRPICLIVVLICLFATFKYHLRYNEHRKFHELKNVNFELAINAKKIHKKLSGLNRSKELLGHLKEISVVDFDHRDVVRHPLVSKIVKAYSDKKTE